MASTPAKRVCSTEVTDFKLCLMSGKTWRSRQESGIKFNGKIAGQCA